MFIENFTQKLQFYRNRCDIFVKCWLYILLGVFPYDIITVIHDYKYVIVTSNRLICAILLINWSDCLIRPNTRWWEDRALIFYKVYSYILCSMIFNIHVYQYMYVQYKTKLFRSFKCFLSLHYFNQILSNLNNSTLLLLILFMYLK